MSLIERAVKKIGEHPPAAPNRPADDPPAASAPVFVEPAMASAPSGAATASPPARPAPQPARAAPAEPPAPSSRPPLRINLDALRERGYLVPDGPPTPLSQQFRVIKRPLLTNAFGRGAKPIANGKRVMVTSSFPGEGKSFCAINLAISIAAERDHSVLLVDADVAKPSVPRELGIETGAGLMDWLIDGGPDLDELVRPTNIDKLSILPAGRRHEQATEYIASDAMTRFLEQLSACYPHRIIVFDSPPLLPTTEARVLATYMGQIVMIVEAGKTPRSAVDDALSTIESCEVVGLVLNKARQSQGAGGYGYGYGGYGYGAE